jgi:RNA polymerase sigma-70 factor, ECF subfamily
MAPTIEARLRIPDGRTSVNVATGDSDPDDSRDSQVDALLRRIEAGDQRARSELIELLYEDLRRRAASLMRRQHNGHTLQVTALVNEACLRLLGSGAKWTDRMHFLYAAAAAMRSVIVDHARARARQKRSAPGRRVPLDAMLEIYDERKIDVLELDDAIGLLAQFDERMARAAELRFFACLDAAETARVLDLPKRTFERHWTAAMAWLKGRMS